MTDNFGRPEWDDYFMSLALCTSIRSLDPRTKHGCVIVDNHHRVLTMGYNGPLRGVDDEKVSLSSPEKYYEMEHAERNAIYSYSGSLEGATAYITGEPCYDCLRALIQKGVSRIVCGPIKSVMCDGQSEEAKRQQTAISKMLKYSPNVSYERYNGNMWETFDNLKIYLATKGIVHPTTMMMKNLINNSQEYVDLQKALKCLFLEVDSDVAGDIQKKVEAFTKKFLGLL